MIDDAITELKPVVGTRKACQATGRPQATHYRRHRTRPASQRPPRERKPQPRALAG
jgi:putative transposase